MQGTRMEYLTLNDGCRVIHPSSDETLRPNGRGTRCPAYLPQAQVASPRFKVTVVLGE